MHPDGNAGSLEGVLRTLRLRISANQTDRRRSAGLSIAVTISRYKRDELVIFLSLRSDKFELLLSMCRALAL
jgi:hypothetical protein